MRLAYLCNVYPAVSHSFVRREIEAVERAGHEVQRFSMRPPHDGLRDQADLREAQTTISILGQGWSALIGTTLLMLAAHPLQGLRAASEALKVSGRGLKQKARGLVYFVEAAWLARRLRATGVQHLHAHFGTNPATVAAISRAWGGPPFSFTIHGPDEFDAPEDLKLREKVAGSTFVAAISSFGSSQLMRWVAGRDWSKIEIVRCGLDRDFLDANVFPPPMDSVELLTVARLSQQKGLPLLIDACDSLAQAGRQFHLTIVGYGEYRDTLERRIRQLGLENQITLAGIRTAEEIRTLLRDARALVLSSFAEGLPVVIMEALALARPVITTSIAGIPELVDDECGWVVPAGSKEPLAKAMASALDASSKELFAKGSVGRQRVIEMHDIDRNASTLVSAIVRHQLAEGQPLARGHRG